MANELTRRDFLRRAALAGAGAVAGGGLLDACASGAPGSSGAGTSSGGTAQRTFTFAYDQPADTGYGVLGDAFGKKLGELSAGKFSINQFPNASLGTEPEMAQKVRTGDIDFVINSTANTAALVPQAGAFSLHFLFRDYDHLQKSVRDAELNRIFKDMIKAGTTGAFSLGLMTLGFRNMYSKSTISGVNDIKGKKVRVQATKSEDQFFGAYGGVPIHMPFGQVYTSLQTGVVQIAENGNDIYLKNKHYEVAPVLNQTQHEANNNHLWMSEKTSNALTSQQRKWVEQAADYARGIAITKSIEFDQGAIPKLQAVGVKWVPDVDKSGFKSIAVGLQDSAAKDLGTFAVQLVGRVRKL